MFTIEDLKKVITSGKCISEYGNDKQIDSIKTIKFGNYMKNNENSKEPIEWLLLSKEDNKVLLLSKYIVDCKKFNEEQVDVEIRDTTLYRWLWNDFFNSAFSVEEQSLIGNITCLSLKELQECFNIEDVIDNQNDLLKAYATQYAKMKQTDYFWNEYGSWWLSDNGWNKQCALFVDEDGRISKNGGYVDFNFGVRPVILLTTKK